MEPEKQVQSSDRSRFCSLTTHPSRLPLDAISNDTILGVPPGRSRLTSKDLEQIVRAQAGGKKSKRARISITSLLHIPAALASSYGLGGFQNENQVNPSLPDPATGGQPVYLVCKAPSFSSGLFSTGHWSIYSQGHFFHLGIEGPAPDASESRGPLTTRTTVLRPEDLSDHLTREARAFQTRQPPLIAYEVSRTDYTPAQIRMLAQWLITRLSTYDLLRSNCQIFVLELMHRTAMTRRQYTTFVGTASQIAAWDLCTRVTGKHYSCIGNGFELSGASSARNSSARMPDPISSYLRIMNVGARARAIRTLHDRGPLVVYAIDPTGQLSTPQYYLWQWSEIVKDMVAHLKLHYGDMVGNARRGRWGRGLWSEDVTERLTWWRELSREGRTGRWVGGVWVVRAEGWVVRLRHPWEVVEGEGGLEGGGGQVLPQLPGKTFRGFVVEAIPVGEREGAAGARPGMTLVSSCMR